MSAATQDQDESVLIAVKALGDMRNATLRSPTLHPPSLNCAYISRCLTPLPLTPLSASQPTPALSVTSSSNSPTLTCPTLASEDHVMDSDEADFVGRLSTFPGVSTALRAYEQSKASSRVVKVCFRLPRLLSPNITEKERFIRNLVWRGDDGVFHEEHIAARHRPLAGHS